MQEINLRNPVLEKPLAQEQPARLALDGLRHPEFDIAIPTTLHNTLSTVQLRHGGTTQIGDTTISIEFSKTSSTSSPTKMMAL